MGEKDRNSRRDVLKVAGTLAIGAAATSLLPAGEAIAAKKKKAPRWAMVIDLRRCIGCRGCTVACKSEFGVPLGSFNAVVKQMEVGKYPETKKHFLPRLCNHCEGTEKVGRMNVPPCVKICPEYPKPRREVFITPEGKKIRYNIGATYKRPDGAILFDNDICIGCEKCIKECPYGSRYINRLVKLKREDREKDYGIGKCTLCQHRIDKGLVPACVNTCQGRARIFGDFNDPNSEVSKLAKEFNLVKNKKDTTLEKTIVPEKGKKPVETDPQVFYIDPAGVLNMYRIPAKTKEAEFRDQFV